MSRMTADDMLAEARLALGGETSETISPTQLLRWLNRAYLDIAGKYRPPELETSLTITTSSGTAEYEIPALDVNNNLPLILKVHSIIDDTNNVQLYPWSRWQYDRSTQGDSTNVTGGPIYWFESGVGSSGRKQFTFYPTPAGTYTVNVIYTKSPDELVTSPAPTSPVIKDIWDEVIVFRAAAKGWNVLGDRERSAGFWTAANDVAKIASEVTHTASYVPYYPTSVVGRALQ